MTKPPDEMTWYEVPVRVFAPSGELARALVYRPLYTAAVGNQLGEFGVGIATRMPVPVKPKKESASEPGSHETLHV